MSNETIEVNGEFYEEIQHERGRTPKRMPAFLMVAMMMGGLPSIKEPERPDVDIVKEYGLIQLKKSRLIRSQREWVISVFESNYRKIKSDEQN